METQPYTVEFDPETNKRFSAAYVRSERGAWVRLWLSYSLWTGILTAFLIYAGTFHKIPEDIVFIGITSVAIGLLMPFVMLWEHLRKSIEAGSAFAGRSWNCLLSEEHWSFTNDIGVTKSIPWAAMKITFETEDAWVVRFGDEQMTVFRQPLRDAGLEAEFLSRVPVDTGDIDPPSSIRYV